jgi:hypothetical protein
MSATDVFSSPADRRVAVPRACTLEGFTDTVSRSRGVALGELDPITTLLIRTDNSLYRVTVTRPEAREVLVQGGQFFPETTHACLSGSSVGGSLLRLAWVGIGLRMEFHAGGGRIVTSPVRAIGIERDEALPGPF